MEYRVIALRQETADEVRTSMRAPGYGHPAHVEVARGSGPCRLCLRPFRIDEEERVLFTYNPFPDDADLPSPGPVFVHKAACRRHDASGFPPGLLGLPLALEGYDDSGVAMIRVRVTGDPRVLVQDVLSRPWVAYAHLRHAEAGCFVARVERSNAFPVVRARALPGADAPAADSVGPRPRRSGSASLPSA